eukprot:TRINITY_DN5099_c1_g1_i1.p1 TRINITY_DN5099_c1_g1~~TRINITY_DN5099_c1_g1_i1.p1  ORF type:complete len:468 (-),score=136.23 TRINITY_DN5099_c1_g1_i1:155-1483(-)
MLPGSAKKTAATTLGSAPASKRVLVTAPAAAAAAGVPSAEALHAAARAAVRDDRAAEGVRLRPLAIDDLLPIWEMGEQLFEEKKWPNLYRVWDAFTVTNYFTSDPEFCIVAEHVDKGLVGFCLGAPVKKGTRKFGYLEWLGIRPDFQRGGLARKLFDRFLGLMLNQGVTVLFVDTQADNAPALKFFERLGFTVTKRCVYLSRDIRGTSADAGKEHLRVQVLKPAATVEDSHLPPRRHVRVHARGMYLADVGAVFHMGEQIFTAAQSPTLYRNWDEYSVVDFFNSDSDYCFVAETIPKEGSGERPALVGFCLGCTVEKPKKVGATAGMERQPLESRVGYVAWLGVRDGLRRHGVGTLLYLRVAAALAESGVATLLVDTEEENTPAVSFFTWHGFGSATSHVFLDLPLTTAEEELPPPVPLPPPEAVDVLVDCVVDEEVCTPES